MKIKKLWVSEYKNIKDQWFEFDNDSLITLLVGKNGLGKSNLIEAITGVLRQLDLAENTQQLTIKVDEYFFDFIIEYECRKNDVKIIAKNQKLNISLFDENNEWKELGFKEFLTEKEDKYLPQNILVYYSGENKRIKKLFNRHREIRESKLKRSSRLSRSYLGRLFYVEENYGELIFFLLWIFRHKSKLKAHIDELFTEFAEIEKTSKIELILCNPSFYSHKRHKGVEDIINQGYVIEDSIWNLTGDVSRFFEILFNNQISKKAPTMYRDEHESNIKGLDEFILFNELNYESLIDSLLEEFKTPMKVFDVLEASYSTGIIYNISSEINKGGASIKHDFSELSEGEQQLITVIGLLLITSETDALYLFDEPDTHLNPNWQRDYARLLKRFNIIHDNSQIIVSTHSPLIVQSAEEADMFLFKRENNKIIIDKNSHKLHNWRLDQVLVSDYFGFDSARPPSLDEYMVLKEEILNKFPFEEEDEKKLAEFENEFGVLPTGETVTEIKTLQLMNHFTKIQDDKNKK